MGIDEGTDMPWHTIAYNRTYGRSIPESINKFTGKSVYAFGLILVFFFFSLAGKASFLGAELHARYVSENEIAIELIQYWSFDESEISESASVAVFEGLQGLPKIPVNLKLVDQQVQEQALNLECGSTDQENKYLKLYYKGTVAVMPIDGGYNVVWLKESWYESNFKNIEDTDQGGVRLVVAVGKAFENTSEFGFPSFFNLCRNQNARIHMSLTDSETDEVQLEFFAFDQIEGVRNIAEPDFNIELAADQPPPYQKAQFAKGYSGIAPLGKDKVRYDAQANELKIGGLESGFYLMGAKLIERREGVVVNEIVRVFRIKVLSN